jgi:hypothetical protein
LNVSFRKIEYIEFDYRFLGEIIVCSLVEMQ